MKIKSYTLAEALIAICVVGIIGASVLTAAKQGNYKAEAYKKAGLTNCMAINLATRQILAKYSTGFDMTTLKTTGGTAFSITDSGADANLAALYKTILRSVTYTAPSTYTGTVIKNEAGTAVGPSSGYKISDFKQGFLTRNKIYIAFKLNGNCTTTESYIYDPSVMENRSATKSCGLLLFDVNSDGEPNLAGVDIYILSINRLGIR